ncbi:hypothetical protein HanPSC8_Chr13g0559611 [Helianthus annuus]|nr:hypothetical protein HanPSC8_Chr13g0559611 [Helianthus annuus]
MSNERPYPLTNILLIQLFFELDGCMLIDILNNHDKFSLTSQSSSKPSPFSSLYTTSIHIVI